MAKNEALRLVRLHRTIEKITKFSLEALGARPLKIRGQNSLMESMSVGTPVVVCPGFGDQPANAAKVQAQGWGVKVDRPKADQSIFIKDPGSW